MNTITYGKSLVSLLNKYSINGFEVSLVNRSQSEYGILIVPSNNPIGDANLIDELIECIAELMPEHAESYDVLSKCTSTNRIDSVTAYSFDIRAYRLKNKSNIKSLSMMVTSEGCYVQQCTEG